MIKEKLKEHDKQMKEAADSSDQNAGGKGKRVPIVDRIQSQTRKVEVRPEETKPMA